MGYLALGLFITGLVISVLAMSFSFDKDWNR